MHNKKHTISINLYEGFVKSFAEGSTAMTIKDRAKRFSYSDSRPKSTLKKFIFKIDMRAVAPITNFHEIGASFTFDTVDQNLL